MILICDLNFASGLVNPERVERFRDMATRGYTIAGTTRHRLRQWQYDPAREIANHDRLLDLFEASYQPQKNTLYSIIAPTVGILRWRSRKTFQSGSTVLSPSPPTCRSG